MKIDKKRIEDYAWEMYQRGMKLHWKDTDPFEREDFSRYEDYNMYMEASEKILKKGTKKVYPIIEVPPTGNKCWVEGARTLCFVYSKHKGNFILEGYYGDVQEYLKKNYTKYFCYYSLWHNGKQRGFWKFWKERDVSILNPSKTFKHWKFRVISKEPQYSYRQKEKIKAKFEFKRMPNRWIPEFDKL